MDVHTVVRHEATVVFDADFWLECEREADRIYRRLTGDAVGAGLIDP